MKQILFINEEQTYNEVLEYSKDNEEIIVTFEEITPYPLLSSYLIKLFRLSKKNKFRLVFIIPENKIYLEYFRELKKFMEIYSSIEEYENLKIYTSFEIKIYEEDIHLRKLMKIFLIDNHFSIKERNVNNFFDKKHDCQYNSLYIIDFSKYKMRIIEEIKKIKKENKDSIVVISSKEEDAQTAIQYMSIGIDYVIIKPFEIEEFLKIIKKLTIEAYFKRENRLLLEKITKSEKELRALYEQVDSELKLASDIQKSFLPQDIMIINNYEITYFFKPSSKIGGDFYENIPLNEEEIFIAFADISGHGIPASLLSSMLKMSIANKKHILKTNDENRLNRFLEELNEDLINVFPKGKFVSMFSIILNTKNDTIIYSKTSQEPALLLENDEISPLNTEGVLLGMFSKKRFPKLINFETKKIKLSSNSKIVLYTDGITELENENLELYGEKRFHQFLKENMKEKNDIIIEKLLISLEEFTKNNKPIDDISLLIINNEGRENVKS